MASVALDTGFIVWGFDQTAYGPVELPTLVSWIKDERVTADTWLFVGKNNEWQKASDVSELQLFFRPKAGGSPGATRTPAEVVSARAAAAASIPTPN